MSSLVARPLADVEVTLTGCRVFVPARIVRPLVDVLDATGIVDGVGLPRMEAVPDKSIVEAAFASALAVGGKPKTLQMFAMAPKVAVRDEHSSAQLKPTC